LAVFSRLHLPLNKYIQIFAYCLDFLKD
jgi:hypothetical protein